MANSQKSNEHVSSAVHRQQQLSFLATEPLHQLAVAEAIFCGVRDDVEILANGFVNVTTAIRRCKNNQLTVFTFNNPNTLFMSTASPLGVTRSGVVDGGGAVLFDATCPASRDSHQNFSLTVTGNTVLLHAHNDGIKHCVRQAIAEGIRSARITTTLIGHTANRAVTGLPLVDAV